ncbi:NmrA-like family protein [Pirellulimonas nuda]|uniref:NmrA-like family protein n=1 Tax=Pirellulimonas nuda TaxID=2528009 RepID=A0A518D8B8_9BACT|nr:SDR family oxidoreductase [Pirellulimonas nuda]QDU87729.1 NmrA-like family protein [Pirellulimonas nuda]
MGPSASPPAPVIVTGATGYVGGRLVPELLQRGLCVRCLVREPRKLQLRPWRNQPGVEVVKDDLSDKSLLVDHLRGCSAAYYLIHSMISSGEDYAGHDRKLAEKFARAAAEARLPRTIYLGGLGEMGAGLSEHLRSRREVEDALASTGVPLTTLRAAMIIGSGSASFEILRYLVERLPVMVTPSWVRTQSQPIAIDDVLYWLAQCLRTPETVGQTLEIGGADVMRYDQLMKIMASELGLPERWVVPVPVLTPKLSSHWIGLVTPVSHRIARPLAEGLRNRVVVNDHRAAELMPHTPLGVQESIHRAVKRTRAGEVPTRWSAAGPIPGDPDWAGGKVFEDIRSITIQATPARVFRAVCRVGGGHGWYSADVLWRIRGWMDLMVGGPGLRRGRRDPNEVEFGEALDFWRVVGLERDRSLRLLAEMKLPGVARLDFDLAPTGGTPAGGDPQTEDSQTQDPESAEATNLTMTARFRPRGLSGLAYWYSVLPLHHVVFGGMLRGIQRAAEAPEGTE